PQHGPTPETIPASSERRGTTLVRSIHSRGPWSSPPTGPRASSVGTPAADVVLASHAPPHRPPPAARGHHRPPARGRPASGRRPPTWCWHPTLPRSPRHGVRSQGP